ncbi:MAG: hypothetical protein LAO79_16430 [Acidobacteriia bacterium]|nr:hypothetical protein [Terriglobia bacterium]
MKHQKIRRGTIDVDAARGTTELEELRTLVGPDAQWWSLGQLQQLDRDLDVMAALLLDIYRTRKHSRRAGSETYSDFDRSDTTD